WPDELRKQYQGHVSSRWHLRRPHPQGREPGGLAGAAIYESGTRHQHEDRQGARSHSPDHAPRPRRRGIGMNLMRCIRTRLPFDVVYPRCMNLGAIGGKRTCPERRESVDPTQLTDWDLSHAAAAARRSALLQFETLKPFKRSSNLSRSALSMGSAEVLFDQRAVEVPSAGIRSL